MSDKFRFGRPQFTIQLTHGAGATTATASATMNGIIRQIKIKTPAAVDASATITVNILDSDSDVVYTKGTLAANATSINLLTQDLSVPVSGTQTVQVVFSAAQTATDTTTIVTIVLDRG